MEKILKIMRDAEAIEQEGRQYYIDSTNQAENKLVKELFRTLADEELIHFNKIRQIAEMVSKNQDITDKEIKLSGREGSLFDLLVKDYKPDQPSKTEIDVLKFAEKLEEKSIVYYKNASKLPDDSTVSNFLLLLEKEEEGHLRSIRDTMEYIEDPSAWFSRKEKSHYDGA